MSKGAYIGVEKTTYLNSLGEVAVGSTVKINENGVPVDYLVVHQGLPSAKYDASCDGTWVLRKDCYQAIAWDSTDGDYENSDIHAYLNSTFLSLFDANVQSVIKQAKIPYTKGLGTTGSAVSGANGLSTKVFLLCGQEVNVLEDADGNTFKEDATVLSYFVNAGNSERIAYMDGEAQYWALRTGAPQYNAYICRVRTIGDVQQYPANSQRVIRPAVILPSGLSLTNGVVTGAYAESVTQGVARKIKKGYMGVDGVARKIKKAYIGDEDNIARCCWSSVASVGITSTGDMTDYGLVAMGDGNTYRLVAITSSGTITFEEPVTGEVWMCGGGTSGCCNTNVNRTAGGGAGAFAASGTVGLSGSMVAVVGAGGSKRTSIGTGNHGGLSSFGGMQTSVAFTAESTAYSEYQKGMSGGTGGGGSRTSDAGTGDGVTKYPFGDDVYFAGRCHCAGGGAGGFQTSLAQSYRGGDGGTNGGAGEMATQRQYGGGSGGSYGGGSGGEGGSGNPPTAATFYGGGGGGSGTYYTQSWVNGFGEAGYQGVIYIRIKAA